MNSRSKSVPEVFVITHFPSPYQVELFDAVAEAAEISLSVLYLQGRSSRRQWSRPTMRHEHAFADENWRQEKLEDLVKSSNLVVVNFYQSFISLRAVRLCARYGKPVAFWGERPHSHSLSWASRALRQLVFRPLHQDLAVWGIGSLAVSKYREEFGDACTYSSLPYFSNLSRFSIAGATRSASRNETRFLYSGTLSPRKGVDVLVDAFLALASARGDVSLTFVGDGELRPRLEQCLAEYQDRVNFLGFRDWHELPEIYAGADVLCVPSRHDGWALVVPEGLAAGMPVISTWATGAAVDLIASGENGWVVKPGLVEPFLEAMKLAASLTAADRAEKCERSFASIGSHGLSQGADAFARESLSAMNRPQRRKPT